MNKLHIVYEDNHIIVVIKPCNIPVQADKSGDIDMLTMVKLYIKDKYNKPGEVYLGLVHRLDRMVGGLVVFAKTSKAASRLSEYIRNREFKKKYMAVVNGTISGSSELKDFLIKDERINMSRVVTSNVNGSKEAILVYNTISNFKYNNKDYSLVNIDLKTGRHHQIRVQLANAGYPLYGDIKYGQKINKVGQNLALWACYLSFYHPTKDEYLEFNSNPMDMIKLENNNKLYDIDKIWMV
ncbi:MAG: RluA family pseudouridine synthase [Clostridia bacterium]|nr:RluA family pseudouridine synthase [Clostridia bacterium]MDD4386719.1 RluA family pseudouridine synthase [Clostridia bacterium]